MAKTVATKLTEQSALAIIAAAADPKRKSAKWWKTEWGRDLPCGDVPLELVIAWALASPYRNCGWLSDVYYALDDLIDTPRTQRGDYRAGAAKARKDIFIAIATAVQAEKGKP